MLSERIDAEMKEAARAQDKRRLGTLRMLKSALKYREIETGKALEDAGFTVREELDAFAVKISDRPGALASVLRPIADAELNVGVTYSLADGRIAFASRDISQLSNLVQEAQAIASRS